ncbi:hypothetical protein C3941_19735 [Kaistia algarum]|uniref:hypothetical protein n=1 Tax=Kaistia algarum TaxID=2083279 RepID=UPI000CE7F1E0|nr:hypothetical protein [Kaistia algarum]MCX5516223.1 hypothetical protein [Kaistia algarum]PPE78295.1 hypothetical protein C3941_19735 [Kaistia algarum]
MIIALLVLILLAILFPGLLRAAFVCVALIVLFAIGSSHRASAMDMPTIDVDSICSKRGGIPEVNQCIAAEQGAYDQLQVMWPALSAERQATCMDYFHETAISQPFPLTYLNACVVAQLNQQQDQDFLTKRQTFKP